MRSSIRAAYLGVALAVSAAGLAACQRQAPQQDEAASDPSIEERQAEMAAEQLAALGGPPSDEQRAAYQGDFQASGGIAALAGEGGEGGAEGVWDLRLMDDYVQFSRPGLDDGGGIPGEREFRERGMRVVAGDVIVTIMQQSCTASGGVELPYVAHVLFDGVAYQGCARRGIEEGERPTWASVLPELIPSIDLCLMRATSRPARITFASAIEEGAVSVRLRQANGARHECIVVGGRVELFETLGDLDRRPSESDPEFQRGGAEPRAESCRSVHPAASRGGEHLGWIVRRTC